MIFWAFSFGLVPVRMVLSTIEEDTLAMNKQGILIPRNLHDMINIQSN